MMILFFLSQLLISPMANFISLNNSLNESPPIKYEINELFLLNESSKSDITSRMHVHYIVVDSLQNNETSEICGPCI